VRSNAAISPLSYSVAICLSLPYWLYNCDINL
jgi:hypothetical protein